MELTFIKERQLAGIEAAKRKGIYKGRSKMVDEAEICKRMTNRLAQSIAALYGQI
jgi:DNA invertase Pin-like site-specific DNA recombinase